jgi:hypothetical protein
MTENKKTASRVAARYVARIATAQMDQEKLIQIFDSLKPKQRVMVTMKAVMSMSDRERGTPTEYIVTRRGKGRYGETLGIFPASAAAEGRKPSQINKTTLYKRPNHAGEMTVSVALGDMAAKLIAIEPL